MNVPDYVSPIIGHRVWLWDGSRLVSLNGELWHPGKPLAAECKAMSRPHQPPQTDCSCGVYAARSPEQLFPFRQLDQIGYAWLSIYGQVYLWGNVIEHSLGWRAQFAYPKSLVLGTHMFPSMEGATSILDALTVYGAEICLANEERTTPLWSKRTGYDKDGLDILRAVAMENILKVAVFATDQARVKLLQDQVRSGLIGAVVLSEVKLPLSTMDPIFKQLREQRVRVVLVDLDSQRLDESIRAIRIIRAAAGQVAILAIGQLHSSNTIMAAMAAGADEYLDRGNLNDITAALARHSLKRTHSEGDPIPPGGPSRPDDPIPPSVYVPLGRGPRPMRPREVALAL